MREPTDPDAPPAEGAPETPSTTPAAEPAPAAPAAAPPEPPPDWETRFKYLLADFENFRKRSDREREALRARERADLLRALLPIHEALERAHESVARTPKSDPVRKGMELVVREFDGFLHRNGVEAVASIGRPFDAALHEAVVEAPATPKLPDGTIAEVVQQGYRFSGGLLRPAKVVVARAPSEPPAPDVAPAEASPAEEDASDDPTEER